MHRHELSGALHGLMRVRCFTQDDAHIFMTPEQIKDEIKGVVQPDRRGVHHALASNIMSNCPPCRKTHMGTGRDVGAWRPTACSGALDELGYDYVVNEGDGAFYGPKIDFHLTDCLGRTWQCGTIQLDYAAARALRPGRTPVRTAQSTVPIMIHRVVFGSIERFIGILTEHFAGAFPMWLAPVQVKIMTDHRARSDECCREVGTGRSTDAGLRAEN